jgi:hypothetical protein
VDTSHTATIEPESAAFAITVPLVQPVCDENQPDRSASSSMSGIWNGPADE